ncbi:MAG: acetolactate decarboxylase, partial [Actinobacteria bacterium]|nr:acetolactate decarboxylase [Actinomycetota bacterium]
MLDGNYDGELTFAELGARGDFGLGTFDALDGEMIGLDGA